jgi:hypothetical protein
MYSISLFADEFSSDNADCSVKLDTDRSVPWVPAVPGIESSWVGTGDNFTQLACRSFPPLRMLNVDSPADDKVIHFVVDACAQLQHFLAPFRPP